MAESRILDNDLECATRKLAEDDSNRRDGTNHEGGFYSHKLFFQSLNFQ